MRATESARIEVQDCNRIISRKSRSGVGPASYSRYAGTSETFTHRDILAYNIPLVARRCNINKGDNIPLVTSQPIYLMSKVCLACNRQPSFSPPIMAKRHGDSTHGISTKVKKRKGVKVRTVNIPDSDDEGSAPNIDTEYARLLKTRVATSGKAGSITMSNIPLLEIHHIAHDDSLEPISDNREEIVAENTIPSTPAKKRRKKKNDSVCCTLLTKPFYHADHSPDQDANFPGRAPYRPRRDGYSRRPGQKPA